MFDKQAIIKNFNQVAETYSAHNILPHEVGERLFEQLQLMRITPDKILDLAARDGHFSNQLAIQYPAAEIISIDIAELICHQNANPFTICADAELLPLQTNSIDLIFANLLLPYCQDIPQTIQEIQRVLKPGGLLLFSTFGPDTIKELGKTDFNDMHDIGDLLVQLRFADPVMNMEYLIITYTNSEILNADLKHWGLAQPQGLPFQATKNFIAEPLTPIPFPVSFEIIYGHVWMSDKNTNTPNAAGEIVIPIQNIKRNE